MTVKAARRGRNREADTARRAGGGVLFVDREQPRAIAQAAVRRTDRAGVRRGRRHQRLQSDPRGARWRKIDFTRTAVGKHLLLGGDNLDLTLAWLAETKLGKQLSIRQRSGLRRQCSAAKELLLCDPKLRERRDQRAGQRFVADRGNAEDGDHARGGSGTGARRLPALTPRGEKPKEEKRSLFRELGLPYVSDPAISRHLCGVPRIGGPVARRHPVQRRFLHPRNLRERVADILESWYGKRPEISRIAIWISRWRAARLITPMCGRPARASRARRFAARLLYRAHDEAVPGRLPRAARRGRRRHRLKWTAKTCNWSPTNRWLSGSEFANPYRRQARRSGEVCRRRRDLPHAPLEGGHPFRQGRGAPGAGEAGGGLTEIGTLESWCDSKVSENRWRLQFQLRKAAARAARRGDRRRW